MKNLQLFALVCACAGIVSTADAQTSSNSLVRFRISYGATFFGDVDVELFDSEKPQTVANFLAYVQSGAYDNLILQGLLPGHMLLGGDLTVPNPYSSAPFELVESVSANAPITNEFDVGPLHSNTFGTLAMWHSPNNLDSAVSTFFFNLGDNSASGATNLDAGSYTVFGRTMAGTNLLAFFNKFSEGNGILNSQNTFYSERCRPVILAPGNLVVQFPALPLGYYGLDCPLSRDVFNVQILLLNGPDMRRPKIEISAPASGTVTSSNAVTVRGIASDTTGIDEVRVYRNANAPVAASFANGNWSIVLTNLTPGTNRIVAEAIDTSGNRAATRERAVFHRVPATISISYATNAGTVTGPTNGQLLDLGRSYEFTAKAKPGYLFAGWVGSAISTNSTLNFLMRTNATLAALFVTNLFPYVSGVYNGLFYDGSKPEVEMESSGFFKLSLGTLGAYSAQLRMNGRTQRFSGAFPPNGQKTIVVASTSTNSLQVRLAVDLTNGTGMISGFVSNAFLTGTTGNLALTNWVAELTADRAYSSATTNPAPVAGRYTMLIPADTNSLAVPSGDSYARIMVDAKGRLTLAGRLADTTAAAQRISISKSNAWPLYLPLYRGQGAVLGWVQFDFSQADTDFSGNLSWIKRSQPAAQFYPGGFTNNTLVLGSAYEAPSTNRVLNLTDARAAFAGGNLAAPFTNDVRLEADNRITNQGGNELTLSIKTSTGLLRGSVVPPGQTRPVRIRGAVLQKQNRAAGFVQGTNQTGRIALDAQ